MIRRRSVPWIHRYSRPIMGAISVVGALITAYLTIAALSGSSVACPIDANQAVSSCDQVLRSPYGKLFGTVPLSLFGLLAYVSMTGFALSPYLINPENNKTFRNKLDQWTGLLLLVGGTGMAVFSGYLMYISFFKLHEACIYCLSSAACSLALFVLSIIGRDWEEIGQVLFTVIIVGMMTLIVSLGLYASVNVNVAKTAAGKIIIPEPQTSPTPPIGWEISTTSGASELALAKYLTSIGAKMYGGYWCPHCYEQKQLFGKDAFHEIDYVECVPQGKNPRPELCTKAGIKGFPTWEFKGKLYQGTQSLKQLAKESGYKGAMDFQYVLPGG